ncbi:MAG TPA: RNA polymerase sigma factor, partial [Bacteroidales bacterium]|nr:RNA polymerase sigma factor [Bacteroidales bacterium]
MVKQEEQDITVIIQGCIRQNEKSREVLYRKFFGYAMSVALLYAKERNDAIEIVDDSFIKVFHEIKRYDTSKPFKIWLRKIVINTAIDKYRKELKRGVMVDVQELTLQDSHQDVVGSITFKEIINMLKYLPQLHRTVFCLYEIEGYSHEEISKELKIPESSSRVYLS